MTSHLLTTTRQKDLQNFYELWQEHVSFEELLASTNKELNRLFLTEKNVFILPYRNAICIGEEVNRYETSTFNFIMAGLEKINDAVVYNDAVEVQNNEKWEQTQVQVLSDQLSAQLNLAVTFPILYEDKTVGTLTMEKRGDGLPYTEDDIFFLQYLTKRFGLILRKAELQESLEEKLRFATHQFKEKDLELKTLRDQEREALFNLSHKLQTPLTRIQNEIESIKQQFPFKKNPFKVEHALDELSEVIYKLVHFVQLETLQESSYSMLDMSHVCRELVNTVAVVAEEKNIHFTAAIVPHSRIVGSHDLIEELLTNLLSNALRYKKEGDGAYIHIMLDVQDGDVVFSVEDNGIGIMSDEIDTIFTRFYRGRNAKKHAHGSGLGLAIANKIAHLHDAHLSVTSTPQVKTVFSARFKQVALLPEKTSTTGSLATRALSLHC